MLHIICSQLSEARKKFVLDTIKKYADTENKKITLIVPEQYSFTSEKNLLVSLGDYKAAFADVFSFTRLAQTLTRENALTAGNMLTPSCACVLMSMALRSEKDNLVFYRKHYAKKATVNEFLRLSTEFRQNAISPDEIHKLSQNENLQSTLLKEKLSDISKVLKKYDELVDAKYFNPDNYLSILCESAQLSSYFADRIVFIDSFRGFTAEEYSVIEKIFGTAREIYITLCTDTASKDENIEITELFARSKDTANRLYRLAEKSGIPYDRYDIDNNSSYTPGSLPPDLTFLSKSLYRDKAETFEGKCENIILRKAVNIYSECEFTAAFIKKLVRESGYRYRDFAIIARDTQEYDQPLRSALKKCDIDIFEDYRKPVDVSPVINFVSAALSAVKNNYDSDSMMRYIKTGLTGLDDEEISLLDNYCFVWNIKQEQWLNQWTGNPEGADEIDEKSVALLERINTLRSRTVAPLVELKNALYRGVSGSQAVEALWSFIEKTNLSNNIITLAQSLQDDGEAGAVNELKRMWALLIEIIDELGSLLKDEDKVTASGLSDYIELMLSVQTIGSIPQGLDEVVIGSADRIRIDSPKVTFILGANDGVFPAEPDFSSALSLRDREEMRKLGVELSLSGDMKLSEEKLIAYTCICSGTERLIISCTETDSSGNETYPSEFYDIIKSLFPNIKEICDGELDDMFFTQGKQAAFERLAKTGDGVYEAALNEYFSQDDIYADKLAALNRAASGKDFSLTGEIAEKLFGTSMNLSASRIERFYNCPFLYFCEYGLKAKPLKEATLDPLGRGSMVHLVFENILKNHTVDEICEMPEEELKAEIFKICNLYLETHLDESVINARLNYKIGRINNDVFLSVKNMANAMRAGAFRPVGFEVEIGDGKSVPAYVPTGGDGSVKINGTIDRVDIAEDDEGNKYLRIIDYKTGDKVFNLSKAWNGIQIQMPVYMFALMKNGRPLYGDFKPAGMFYSIPTLKAEKVEAGGSPEKSADRLKTKASGLLLDEVKEKGLNEKGMTIKNELSLDMFNIFNNKADSLINGMVSSLKGGKINPCPITDKDEGDEPFICSKCAYKSVCGFDDRTPLNLIKTNAPDCKKIIEEEMNDNFSAGGESE